MHGRSIVANDRAATRTVLISAGILIFTFSALAADIPLSERKSGYEFMTRETRAMQDDDTSNPGMLWVLDGEALWKRKAGEANKSCADCHGDAAASMKGVAARYPAFDAARGRPVDLEERINICRTEQQKATPLRFESKDLLALTAYIARQSRGMPIDVKMDEATKALHRSGAGHLPAPARAAQFVLRELPRRQLGTEACGRTDPAGASHRLSAIPARMADARLAAAAVAQLPDRDAHRVLSAGCTRIRQSGVLPDVARTRHAGRGAGRAAVTIAPTK